MAAGQKTVSLILLLGLLLVSRPAQADSIHQAIWQNNLSKVPAILHASPAVVNTRDGSGLTPLQLAVSTGFEERLQLVELLLRAGADVKARNGIEETTPLHSAAARGYKKAAAQLIAFGADVNAKDHCGLTPLSFAANNDHRDVAELLLAHGAVMDIFAAAALGDIARLQQLLGQNPRLILARGMG